MTPRCPTGEHVVERRDGPGEPWILESWHPDRESAVAELGRLIREFGTEGLRVRPADSWRAAE